MFEEKITAIGTLYTTPSLYASTYKNSTSLSYANYLDNSFDYFKIEAGMNLIALPNATQLSLEDIKNIFPSAVTTVWTYDGLTQKWSGYSKQEDKLSKIDEMQLSSLKTLTPAQGIIVNSLTAETIKFPKGAEYLLSNMNIVENLSSGWHLLGTSRTLTFKELQKLNANILSVWSYSDGYWYASAIEDNFIQSIEKQSVKPLVEVESNRAFWVYVQ